MNAGATHASRMPHPLPVIVLADTSGSMSAESKIEVLNASIEAMAREFASQDPSDAGIQLAVIAFGGEQARLAQPPVDASAFAWQPPRAAGRTPLGSALTIARTLLEDPEQIHPDALPATLVLASDGRPTDSWRAELRALLACERASMASRFAIAIGADADRTMLQAFAGESGARVLEAHQARDIGERFLAIAASVSCAGGVDGRQTLDAFPSGAQPELDQLDG